MSEILSHQLHEMAFALEYSVLTVHICREKMSQAYEFALDKIGLDFSSYQVKFPTALLRQKDVFCLVCQNEAPLPMPCIGYLVPNELVHVLFMHTDLMIVEWS